jgi:lysozyme
MITPVVSSDTRRLIMHFEGVHPHPYLDPVGIVTIGVGHVLRTSTGAPLRGQPGLALARAGFPTGATETQIETWLTEDLATAATAVTAQVGVVLTDAQYGALVSFTFNCGVANFQRSTLLRRLNTGDYACVPTELDRWTRANGLMLAGLVRRRAAEGQLWELGTVTV